MVIDPVEIAKKKIVYVGTPGAKKKVPKKQIQQAGIDIRVRTLIGTDFKKCGLLPMYSYSFECYENAAVPKGMCAQVIVRSSLNRKGVLVVSGLYDPGFRGVIGGTIYAFTHTQIKKGDAIAQIVFHECQGENLYKGKFQDKY